MHPTTTEQEQVFSHGGCHVTVTRRPTGNGYRADWKIEPHPAPSRSLHARLPRTRSGSRLVRSDAEHEHLVADLRLLLDGVCGPDDDEKLEHTLGVRHSFLN